MNRRSVMGPIDKRPHRPHVEKCERNSETTNSSQRASRLWHRTRPNTSTISELWDEPTKANLTEASRTLVAETLTLSCTHIKQVIPRKISPPLSIDYVASHVAAIVARMVASEHTTVQPFLCWSTARYRPAINHTYPPDDCVGEPTTQMTSLKACKRNAHKANCLKGTFANQRFEAEDVK